MLCCTASIARASRNAMREVTLEEGEAGVFARAALAQRTAGAGRAPCRVWRDDLWSVFNRTQENLVRGGCLAAPPAAAGPPPASLLVTERMQPFLRHPCHFVRQTGEGTVQIGDSKEEVGMDDGTTIPEMARIAARAVRCFPILASANIVRTWGALRVMTPDGYPIYQESARCPGAFVVTCHSGITLAPAHAGPLVDWMRTGTEPAEIRGFKAERFDHVQAH